MRLVSFTAAALITALSGCKPQRPIELNPDPTPTGPGEVIIYDYKYFPPTLTVPAGTKVTWRNRDVAPHTATYRSYGDEAFDSGSMGHLATFSNKFKTAGSYSYLCIFHQGMQGTVVVQ